jgi:hypothetical protein
MPNDNNTQIYTCKICNFICSKISNYNTHVTTKSHLSKHATSNDTVKISNGNPKTYKCAKCHMSYKDRSGLWRHKKKCAVTVENSPHEDKHEAKPSQDVDKRDDMIDKLVNSTIEMKEDNREMKEMMMMMMKSQMHNQETIQEAHRQSQETTQEILKETSRQNQETTHEILKETKESTVHLVNKVIEVLPQIGNTTNNNNNNTLNFYLNDTCKDAESIHDFTDRFIERIVHFFKGNYRDIAYKRISLPDNVRDIFYECLDENPQTQNFVQTTDVKNGVFYVKEKKKNDDSQFYGEAEFVKYRDGFAKSGTRLGHAINCALLPCKSECLPILERDFKAKPNEDDYDEEHEDEFQKDKDTYYNTTRTIQDNLMFQTINAMNIFDNKRVRENTLSKTKRQKNGN